MTVLAGARWPEVEPGTLLVLPVGSCEQHGPHLPAATDATVAGAVAGELVARLADAGVPAVLAPTLPVGASGEHAGFPGTLSLGSEVLGAVLVELGRSCRDWAGRLLVVNGHGGNAAGVVAAVTRLRYEGDDAAWLPCAVPDADAHAGRTETSLMLALAPDAVALERAAAGNVRPIADLLPELRAHGVRGVSPNGVLGDPAGASGDEGRRLLDQLGARVLAATLTWDVAADGRLTQPASTRNAGRSA